MGIRTTIILLLAGVAFAQDSDGPVARLKAGDAGAVEAVARVLSGSDRTRAEQAVAGLGRLGPRAAAMVPHLRECLLDDRETIRVAAIRALGSIGKAAAPALPDLERLEGRHAIAVWRAIVRIAAPPVDYFVERVKPKSMRRSTYKNLLALGADGDAILTAMLADNSWHVRYWTAKYGRPENPSDALVARLAGLLAEDESGAVRRAALGALARRVKKDRRVVAPLVAALRNPSGHVRFGAALALGARPEATAALKRALRDKEAPVCNAAAASLGRLGAWNDTVLDLTIAALGRSGCRSTFRGYRRNLRAGPAMNADHAAVAALARGDEPAVRALLLRAKTVKPTFRIQILNLLGNLKEIPPGVAEYLTDGNIEVRRTAAFALAGKKDTRPAVARTLVECLNRDSELKRAAAAALADLGPHAVPFLLAAYKKQIRSMNREAFDRKSTAPKQGDVVPEMIDCPDPVYEELIVGFAAGALPHIDAALREQPHRWMQNFLHHLKKQIGP